MFIFVRYSKTNINSYTLKFSSGSKFCEILKASENVKDPKYKKLLGVLALGSAFTI